MRIELDIYRDHLKEIGPGVPSWAEAERIAYSEQVRIVRRPGIADVIRAWCAARAIRKETKARRSSHSRTGSLTGMLMKRAHA